MKVLFFEVNIDRRYHKYCFCCVRKIVCKFVCCCIFVV